MKPLVLAATVFITLLAGCTPTNSHNADPVSLTPDSTSVIADGPTSPANEQRAESQMTEPVQHTTGESNPIDVALEQCFAQSASTYDANVCVSDAIEAWDAALNQVYGEVMALTVDDQSEIVREAQRSWVAFRDADLQSTGITYRQEMGTGWGMELGLYHLELIRTRTEQLHFLRDALELLEGQQNADG